MIDQEKLTTAQKGKIAELHVATALMAQSAGRLLQDFEDHIVLCGR